MMLQTQNDLSINIVKYPHKYIYMLETKEIYMRDLELDPYEKNEFLIDKNKNTLEFLEIYGCDRYKAKDDFYIIFDEKYIQSQT